MKLPKSFTLANVIRFLLVLIPIVTCAWLVRRGATDVRYYDDWMMAETLVKYEDGTLTWHDIFAVQMEHRLAVPRLIMLGLHITFGKDMRWEIAATFLFLCGTAFNLVWLLRRATGLSEVRQWWLPAMMMFLVLFSPVQWQTLLWPICFTSVIPGFCLTLAMVFWFSRLSRPAALTGAFVCALAATLTFASGLLIWVLMVPTILMAKPEMPTLTRWKYVAAWLVLAIVSLGTYFHDFENAVRPEFAYNQGNAVTMSHNVSVFLSNPSRAVNFVLTFLGCHLMRGLHRNSIEFAWLLGLFSVLLFAAALLSLAYWRRRDGAAWSRALPWLLLGFHSAGTGGMIAMGRMWVTRSLAQAVTARYSAYSLYLTLGLIGLAALATAGGVAKREHWLGRRYQWHQVGVFCAAWFIGLETIIWSYGSRMMSEWQSTRRQGQAELLFVKVIKPYGYLNPLASDGSYVADIALKLDKHGMLSPKPLKSLVLGKDLKIGKHELEKDHGLFTSLWLDKREGAVKCEGYAVLPGSKRAADAIVFATRDRKSGDWRFFGFAEMETCPSYLHESTVRDLEFISSNRWTPDVTAKWGNDVYLVDGPPPPDAEITAWAMDVTSRRVYRIADRRPSSATAPLNATLIYPRRK